METSLRFVIGHVVTFPLLEKYDFINFSLIDKGLCDAMLTYILLKYQIRNNSAMSE